MNTAAAVYPKCIVFACLLHTYFDVLSFDFYFSQGRSQRSNIQGSLHIKLWLSTRENRGLSEEEDMWNEIWQHQQIYTLFLRHNLLKQTVSTLYFGCFVHTNTAATL